MPSQFVNLAVREVLKGGRATALRVHRYPDLMKDDVVPYGRGMRMNPGRFHCGSRLLLFAATRSIPIGGFELYDPAAELKFVPWTASCEGALRLVRAFR